MTTTPASDLRFECPHCRQRIACEPAYAGQLMVCPTCQGGLQIPWGSGPGGELRLKPRDPPASPEPLYPRPATEDFWTEAEWNQRLAADRRQQIKGFFTVRGQLYYAALYAVIAFHAGFLLGWQATVEIVGAPLTALGDPAVFDRILATNPAFWMLASAAIPTGYVIARNPPLMPFGLPYPTGTLWTRRRWWQDEKPEDSKAMHWGSAWVVISMAVFFAELFICLLGGFFCALVKFAFKFTFTGW